MEEHILTLIIYHTIYLISYHVILHTYCIQSYMKCDVTVKATYVHTAYFVVATDIMAIFVKFMRKFLSQIYNCECVTQCYCLISVCQYV